MEGCRARKTIATTRELVYDVQLEIGVDGHILGGLTLASAASGHISPSVASLETPLASSKQR